MEGENLNKFITILLAAALALLPVISCKEDPVNPQEEDNGIDWPSMTSKDDVIEMLVMTYSNPKSPESIPRYRALLHSQYFFGLAPQDVPPGTPPVLTRSEDITCTERMFEYEKILELTIDPMVNTWYELPELEGEPCTDCWAAQPSYFIRAQFGDAETIYLSPIDRAEVSIIIAPDESDPDKWVLRAMYDLCMTAR
jgi:hypothetical protein